MLWHYSHQICNGTLLLMLILFVCAGYAYRVNVRRPIDDPQKRNFHWGAILLAPITWPFLLIVLIFLFIVRALLYAVFLVFFTIAILVIRKLFILVWLDKIATKIGNKLLEANTFLIRVFSGKWAGSPQTP